MGTSSRAWDSRCVGKRTHVPLLFGANADCECDKARAKGHFGAGDVFEQWRQRAAILFVRSLTVEVAVLLRMKELPDARLLRRGRAENEYLADTGDADRDEQVAGTSRVRTEVVPKS